MFENLSDVTLSTITLGSEEKARRRKYEKYLEKKRRAASGQVESGEDESEEELEGGESEEADDEYGSDVHVVEGGSDDDEDFEEEDEDEEELYSDDEDEGEEEAYEIDDEGGEEGNRERETPAKMVSLPEMEKANPHRIKRVPAKKKSKLPFYHHRNLALPNSVSEPNLADIDKGVKQATTHNKHSESIVERRLRESRDEFAETEATRKRGVTGSPSERTLKSSTEEEEWSGVSDEVGEDEEDEEDEDFEDDVKAGGRKIDNAASRRKRINSDYPNSVNESKPLPSSVLSPKKRSTIFYFILFYF